MPDTTIQTIGPVIEILGPSLCRVELPNGKPVIAHLAKRIAAATESMQPGERVVLELTPYDFDQARIIGRAGDPQVFSDHTGGA